MEEQCSRAPMKGCTRDNAHANVCGCKWVCTGRRVRANELTWVQAGAPVKGCAGKPALMQLVLRAKKLHVRMDDWEWVCT